MTDHFTVSVCHHDSSLSHSLTLFAVNVILKERKSKDSITLAWQGPDRPNGVIVEYEVIYYEKVHLLSSFMSIRSSHPHTQITHMLL